MVEGIATTTAEAPHAALLSLCINNGAKEDVQPSSPVSLTRGLPVEGTGPSTEHSGQQTTPSPSPHSSSSELGTLTAAKTKVDVDKVIERLQSDLTGQVVAWAWDSAARLSQIRRAPPVALLAALWPALHKVVGKCTAQDVLEIMESWMHLLQAWPRHFRITDTTTLRDFSSKTIPAAVKRMSEQRLSQMAELCRDIALHPIDPALHTHTTGRQKSPRDLMQPIYAVVATEVAIRVSNPARYVSAATISIVLNASAAWRWTNLRYNDAAPLSALKEATQAALHILRNALEQQQQAEQQPL